MRNVLHIVVSILMWLLFGYYWYVVGRRQIDLASLQSVAVLAGFTLVGIVLTLLWIAHNRKLARRNRRLAAPATPPEAYAADHLGRERAGDDLATLKAAPTVVVRLDDEGRKVCTAATGRGA
ncbi:hypothetical protein KDM41_11505 [bacterium]|nr:hypothetical protein [bacterium]